MGTAVSDADTPRVVETVCPAVTDAVAGEGLEEDVSDDVAVCESVDVKVAVPVPVPEDVTVGERESVAVVLDDAPMDTDAVDVAVPVAVFVAEREPEPVNDGERLVDADVERLVDTDADIDGDLVGDTVAQNTCGTEKD